MDRRKFTKEVSKLISTGVVLSSSQFIAACDDGGEEANPSTLELQIDASAELIAGENFTLNWISNGVEEIDLAYKIDQAANYLTFQRNVDATLGQFEFEVPDNINGSTLTFRISNSFSGDVLAEGIPINLLLKWLIKLSETPELNNVGGFLNVKEVNNPFIVRRTGAESFFAMSLICTHQGCVVGVEVDGSLLCPCHGSRFTAEGAVTNGPANRRLATLRTEQPDTDSLVVFYS